MSGFRARMRIRAFLYAGYATNPRDATSRNLLSIQETSTTSIGVERRGCLTALPVPYFTFYRKSLIFSPATYWSQVKHHFFLWKQIISTRHLSQARKTRSNHGAVMPAMDTLLELCAERRALRAWADKGHPFCQDENARQDGDFAQEKRIACNLGGAFRVAWDALMNRNGT